MIRLTTPLTEKDLKKLKAGDEILLNGIIYTARDMAHKRLIEELKKKKPDLPFDLKGQVIYYTGPAPAKPGYVIGPSGPTTSCRMDSYTPVLLKHGLKGMIGKGNRSEEVLDAIKKYKACYFAAGGGIAALLSNRIKNFEVVAYEDLDTEAIRKLEVEDFPLIVVNDIYGKDLYKQGIKKYKRD